MNSQESRPLSVVVVDDEPDVAVYLAAVLEKKGHTAHTAKNAAEGFALVKNLHPDVACIDIVMPEETGVALFRRIRNDDEVGDTPVVFITALKPEMAELGRRFAARLNEAQGPLEIAYPTQGLSIPSYPARDGEPAGVFWDSEADSAFMAELRANLRSDIPILEYNRHVNDPAFGIEIAELYLNLAS